MLLCLAVCCCFPVAATPEPLADRLTRQMQLNRQRYGIVGQAVVVVHNGKRVFRGVDGVADLQTQQPVTDEQIFPAFSVAKLFVSTLIMQLVEAGQIDLDQPARQYLPALPEPWKHITVRQLLDHTSGLPEYFEPSQMRGADDANARFASSAQAMFERLATQPLAAVPGSETRYTNTNYVVLAQLLQAHYRKPYPQIASERIIAKLHLTRTSIGRPLLPAHSVASAYLGTDGKLEPEPTVAWPEYALAHGQLYTNVDDLSTFLEAVRTGRLVGKETLRKLWQPQTLPNGQRGWFASGWEVGQDDAYQSVGHDGGARVRVRILFDTTLDGDSYSVVYLTNGSARGVWSRVLLDSVLATLSPQRFPSKSLAETLIAFALHAPDERETRTFAQALRARPGLSDAALERAINATGYTVLSNLGATAAIRVFALNVDLFPASSNARDSLAEAYEAAGDVARAKRIRQTIKDRSSSPD
ncbi:serine hydrolase domain-containing protein [Xanthomonas dyei]|uniref:serine hydrolase domain-containing protein n=1 Tax=Xanthomonas dyei TaxID=743699 RepID=UPI001FD31CB4|nr:serine hydrolase domain-containing protein [Xanthomonas dyei]